MLACCLGEIVEHLGIAAIASVGDHVKTEAIGQRTAWRYQRGSSGRNLCRIVMARGDLSQRFRKAPRANQCPAGLAMVDSAEFLFDLEDLVSVVSSALHDTIVGLGHDGGERHSTDVVKNSCGVSEIGIEEAPGGAALGYDRRRDAV